VGATGPEPDRARAGRIGGRFMMMGGCQLAQTVPEKTMAEQLFQITNTVALVAWLPLLFMPGNRFVTERLCRQFVPAALALIYVGVIATKMLAGGPPPGDLGTISGLRQAFSDDLVFAAAWIHYLAFDMVVGSLIAREAVHYRIPWPLRSLSLVCTFLLGPAGYLFYLGLRLRWRTAPDATPLAEFGS
jgi:hypothetical protein